jgi:hypothetical protein
MALCEVKLGCLEAKERKSIFMLYLYNDQDCVGSSTYLLNRWENRPLSCPIDPIRTLVTLLR